MWILSNLLLLLTVAGGLVFSVPGLVNIGAVLTVLSALASLSMFSDEGRVSYVRRPAFRRLTVWFVRLTAACFWIWYGHMLLGWVLVFSLLFVQGAYMYALKEEEAHGEEAKE